VARGSRSARTRTIESSASSESRCRADCAPGCAAPQRRRARPPRPRVELDSDPTLLRQRLHVAHGIAHDRAQRGRGHLHGYASARCAPGQQLADKVRRTIDGGAQPQRRNGALGVIPGTFDQLQVQRQRRQW